MPKANVRLIYGINKLKEFCKTRIPKKSQDTIKLNYEIQGNRITIVEERLSITGENTWKKFGRVQIQFNPEKGDWKLYWWDRSAKWHLYTEIKPKNKIEEIIDEIDIDPIRVFWG